MSLGVLTHSAVKQAQNSVGGLWQSELRYSDIPQNLDGDKIMRVDFVYSPSLKAQSANALIEPKGNGSPVSINLSIIEMSDVFHFGLPGTYPDCNEYATFTFNKNTHEIFAFEPVPTGKPKHIQNTSLYDYLKALL